MSSITTYASDLGSITGIVFDNSNNMYGSSLDICKLDCEGNKTYITLNDSQLNQNIIFVQNNDTPNGCLYAMKKAMYFDKFDLNTNKSTRFSSNENNSNQYGLCADKNNNLYFSGNNPHNIYKIDTSGNITTFINSETTGLNPYGITFDASSNFYICNKNSNSYIAQYSSSGNLLNSSFVTSSGNSVTKDYVFLNVVFDNNNNCYVACINTKISKSQIVQYDGFGNFILVIYSVDNTGLCGLTFDSLGNLYIANQVTCDVMKYVFEKKTDDTNNNDLSTKTTSETIVSTSTILTTKSNDPSSYTTTINTKIVSDNAILVTDNEQSALTRSSTTDKTKTITTTTNPLTNVITTTTTITTKTIITETMNKE